MCINLFTIQTFLFYIKYVFRLLLQVDYATKCGGIKTIRIIFKSFDYLSFVENSIMFTDKCQLKKLFVKSIYIKTCLINIYGKNTYSFEIKYNK